MMTALTVWRGVCLDLEGIVSTKYDISPRGNEVGWLVWGQQLTKNTHPPQEEKS
jgi:N6-adenosine-specific RNA methylase IME4